ncbi:MAG TPA: hypothetical protein VFJ00_03910, partial [Candidatus Limnocylindria bacterium]|nr:hypothetical protein [Candidatus Limnocylindria bacterium]
MATPLALPGALLGLAVGILGADAHAGLVSLVAAALAGSLGAVLVLSRRTGPGIACVALGISLLLGAWRGGAAALPSGPDSVAALIGRGEFHVAGTVIDDPRPRGTSQQVVLDDVAARVQGDAHALRGR